MTGFELQISCVRRDHTATCATTTAQLIYLLLVFTTMLKINERQTDLFWFVFVLFLLQCKYRTKFDYKSVDGVLGIQTLDCRMVGADESTHTAKFL